MKTLSFIFILSLFILTAFSAITIEARKYHIKKSKIHKNKRPKNNGSNNPPNGSYIQSNQSSLFNIMSFGAKADGVSDDSKALLQAWKYACKENGGVVEIPPGFEFLVKPVTLQGPCLPNLVLRIDGTILAPPKIGSWSKFSLYQWLNFKWLQNFTIEGAGLVDGQGKNWWISSQPNQMKKSKKVPNMKPTAMRFYLSYYITVRGIRIVNSPLCHLKFDNSKQVKVENVTISAPEDSPNTDGIHLQNSQGVEIMHSNIGSGDDCVSIQTGCSNIHVHDIYCGPGHGISLGGLGKGKTIACVSNILVENIVMENTLYGARIKTWQGGLGSVRNVTFSSIRATNVKVPINIDQYYCDKSVCKNQTSAVAISGVTFDRINGTYSSQPLRLACSASIPCIDVRLTSIELQPSGNNNGLLQELCSNSYGKTSGQLVPPSIDDCVRSGGDVVKRVARSRENGCFAK